MLGLLFALFVAISIIQAYAFTHPTRNKNLEINREGMHLTVPNLVKATFIGIRPIRHIQSDNPADYDLGYENVTFKSTDNIILKGWLIKSDNPKGTIIMTHGYNSNRGNINISKYFHDNNYNVLMFDFRGHGESGGNYISMGYYEANDVLGAIKYLKSRNDLGSKDVYGLGYSMGAAALIFAEEKQSSFKGLILESTYSDLYQNTANRFKRVYGFPKFPFATSLTFFGGIVLGVNAFSISPSNSIKNIHIPVLLIHDENDDGVTLQDARLIYENANQPKELWIVKGANHTGAYDTDPTKYNNKILSFLRESS